MGSQKSAGCQQYLTTAFLSSMPVNTSQNFLLVAAVRFRPADHDSACQQLLAMLEQGDQPLQTTLSTHARMSQDVFRA